MKMKKAWIALPLLIGIGYLAINAPPAYAVFDFGDVVFDPSSWATLGHIWTEDISNGAKLVQTYNETVKIVKDGLQVYNLAMQMSQRVQNSRFGRRPRFRSATRCRSSTTTRASTVVR